jgi:hypothetical protein
MHARTTMSLRELGQGGGGEESGVPCHGCVQLFGCNCCFMIGENTTCIEWEDWLGLVFGGLPRLSGTTWCGGGPSLRPFQRARKLFLESLYTQLQCQRGWHRGPPSYSVFKSEGGPQSLPPATRPLHITTTNRIDFVLFGKQNRTFGPYLACINMIFISAPLPPFLCRSGAALHKGGGQAALFHPVGGLLC